MSMISHREVLSVPIGLFLYQQSCVEVLSVALVKALFLLGDKACVLEVKSALRDAPFNC